MQYHIEHLKEYGTEETFCDNWNDFSKNLFDAIENEIRDGNNKVKITIKGGKND